MISKKNIANAMSGKTARACDCCIRKRARWYCAADDAFLCQVCDGSVHSANPLARRHERVRLKTSSLKRSDHSPDRLPSWHRGLTRKARTPRHGKHSSKSQHSMEQNPLHIVPDLGVEDTMSLSSSHDGETEEQLLYRVPIYDPFAGELCTSTASTPPVEVEASPVMHKSSHYFIKSPQDGFLPLDLDLEEFATDVETLLGKGLDEESYGIEELGLLNCCPNDINVNGTRDDSQMEFGKEVKAEDELGNVGEIIRECEIEVENDDLGIREPFEFSFDYDHDFPTTCLDNKEEHHKAMMVESSVVNWEGNDLELCKQEDDYEKQDKVVDLINNRRKILLRLDYEAISVAWASQGSPWMNGQRPEINPEDCWPHCMGTCGTGVHHSLHGDNLIGGLGGNGVNGDGGREARVSRYREKRRTRLFSKKIRYEVRKLNAEKRPRMKGRFVKRSSFAPTTNSFPLHSKQ